VAWDNLYQVLYRPFGLAGDLGSNQTPGVVHGAALVLVIAVALLLLFRLPDRVPGLPAVTPALALSLGWIFFWPYQRPWYDVMIIAPLALYPRSRLDMLVLIRLCFGAITYMEAAYVPRYEWVQQVQLIEGQWITSSVRLLTAAALIWLCITRRWGMQPAETSATISPPVLEPLT